MVAIIAQKAVENVQRTVMTDINKAFEDLSKLNQRIIDLEYEISCLQKYKNGTTIQLSRL